MSNHTAESLKGILRDLRNGASLLRDVDITYIAQAVDELELQQKNNDRLLRATDALTMTLDATLDNLDQVRKEKEQLRRMMIDAGMCPDCGEIPIMDEEGPFSHCGCGTQEDYGTRPAQAMQLKLKKQEPSNADAIQALDYLLDVVEQYYLSPNTEVSGSYEERFKVWVCLAREKYITVKRALDDRNMPHTPEQAHGDALAALKDDAEAALDRCVNRGFLTTVDEEDIRKALQTLTASGVPEQTESESQLCPTCRQPDQPLAIYYICDGCERAWKEVENGHTDNPYAEPKVFETPEQAHGDALAALERIERGIVQLRDTEGKAFCGPQPEDLSIVRRHLTASGVQEDRVPHKCPSCGSPSPERHPAVQFEGEVMTCHDPWHQHHPGDLGQQTAESVLRSLASWLGVGGYNADRVDPATFEAKIREGVESVIRVEKQRAGGVPYVPDEVRQLPDIWESLTDGMDESAAGAHRACAQALRKALASAPAVCDVCDGSGQTTDDECVWCGGTGAAPQRGGKR